jgi:two-component system, cell cycle sensor histidine kinase and response regulator CckA
VVDDERIARRVAFRILSEQGYRVFEAADADEALHVLTHARGWVDLVVLDVVMPGSDGVELAATILSEWPDQHILFMSAHSAEVLARHGLADLKVPFLAKPYTRNEVLAKVRAVLARPRRRSTEVQQRGD